MKNRTLVVDIGGTSVKLMMANREPRQFESGMKLTPKQFVKRLKTTSNGWDFKQISIGFPAPFRRGRIVRNPKHLGKGWPKFDFKRALKKPVRIINDASMQALGSYNGRRMLFLGLGTGLGSALVWDKTVLPLELGDLPYREGDIIENFLGIPGLKRLGEKKWKAEVLFAIQQLKKSFIAEHVVLGGGLVHRFKTLPRGFERGGNENAFLGGLRLWETDPRTRTVKWQVL